MNMNKYVNGLLKYKWLLYELVRRDLKLKYRRSILGYIWSLLNPLLMMLVISAIFSHFFRFVIENYPIYLLTGQIIFSFYSEATNTAMTSVLSGGRLLSKVYLPKYILPMSRVLSSFVNLLFSLIAIAIVMIITETPIKPAILLFPIPLFYVLLFSLGVGMLLSVYAVFFRDVIHLYGVLISVLMYFTPIFYPISILPELPRMLMQFNPLFHFVECFRSVILYGRAPSLEIHLYCLGFSLASLMIGTIVFKKKQSQMMLYI
jgi:ABC-2 type transport system permease protein